MKHGEGGGIKLEESGGATAEDDLKGSENGGERRHDGSGMEEDERAGEQVRCQRRAAMEEKMLPVSLGTLEGSGWGGSGGWGGWGGLELNLVA